MKKNIQIHELLRRKIAAITLAGAAAAILITAPYAFVSADDTTSASQNAGMTQQTSQMPHPQFNMENHIQQYVTSGKITSEQAAKLQKALQEQHQKNKTDHEKFMKELPDKTGISEDTLKEIMKRPDFKGKRMGNPGQRMQQFVKDGKVTQAEATALETYFKNNHPQKPEAGATKQQRKSPDEMCQEIATGTGLSQSRVKEIMELMRPQGAPPQGQPSQDGQGQPPQDEQ